ncbi:uncharacterized protein LOC123427793 [Hordeum vulgare subsp. vulgare]|uniref:uncharacterized protein LOC123427793 n=1 Tax=Hordeum vulgare subsp. vulgare TaxID=112509 RepID=UPI001D1A514E|nr:uncharacterized protein LOC123427793 [Hordeum vulgare subsp. vulgare]
MLAARSPLWDAWIHAVELLGVEADAPALPASATRPAPAPWPRRPIWVPGGGGRRGGRCTRLATSLITGELHIYAHPDYSPSPLPRRVNRFLIFTTPRRFRYADSLLLERIWSGHLLRAPRWVCDECWVGPQVGGTAMDMPSSTSATNTSTWEKRIPEPLLLF